MEHLTRCLPHSKQVYNPPLKKKKKKTSIQSTIISHTPLKMNVKMDCWSYVTQV